MSGGADGDGEAETELLGETLGLVDGDTELLGDTLAEGETLALMLADGLTEADGDTLLDGLTLGLMLEDGAADRDAIEDGEIDADGLRLGLMLLDGLTLELGDTEALASVTQTCTSFDAALSPSPLPARTMTYQTPDSVRKSARVASRASGSSMMKSSV